MDAWLGDLKARQLAFPPIFVGSIKLWLLPRYSKTENWWIFPQRRQLIKAKIYVWLLVGNRMESLWWKSVVFHACVDADTKGHCDGLKFLFLKKERSRRKKNAKSRKMPAMWVFCGRKKRNGPPVLWCYLPSEHLFVISKTVDPNLQETGFYSPPRKLTKILSRRASVDTGFIHFSKNVYPLKQFSLCPPWDSIHPRLTL